MCMYWSSLAEGVGRKVESVTLVVIDLNIDILSI